MYEQHISPLEARGRAAHPPGQDERLAVDPSALRALCNLFPRRCRM
jgi:hypothetical protein